MTLFLAITAHVELRYYILQRVVMWGTVAFWVSRALVRMRGNPIDTGRLRET